MSEQERSHLADCPQYRQLTELHGQQATLTAGLSADDFATPSIKTAYEAALQGVTEQSTELAADPELQERVIAAGTQAVKVLEQLGPLRGILSSEEISEMESGAREDASNVADYYRRYGANTEEARELLASLANVGNFAVAAATSTVPRLPRAEPQPQPAKPDPIPAVPSSPSPTPEDAPTAKEITLIFGEDGVKIGKRGQVIPYVPKSAPEFRSRLTHARRSMLTHMASHPGQMFTSPELWEVAFGPKSEYDRKSMVSIRGWLQKLTYRREPLTVSSGSNLGYRLGISPSFDTQVVERGQVAPKEKTAPSERELGGVHLGSLYVVAQRLISNNHVLEAHGIATADENLQESLASYRPDMSHLLTDADKRTYRDSCVREVQEVFNDDDRFYQLVESLGEDETLMGLVEYLMDLLDKPEQRRFVGRLMGARPHVRGVMSQRQGSVEGVMSELIDEKGVVLWPISDTEDDKPQPDEPDEAPADDPAAEDQKPADTGHEGRLDRRLPPPSEPKEADDSEPEADQPSRGEHRRRVGGEEVWVDDERTNEEKRAKIQGLEDYAYELSIKFLKNFDSTKSYSRPQLQSVFTDFTPRMGVDARENKVGPKERHNPLYSLDDMLHVLIYSNSQFQPLSAHKRKATQNLVKRVVNQGIKRAKIEVGATPAAA